MKGITMRILKEKTTLLINVRPGDGLILYFTDTNTGREYELLRQKITEPMAVNYCAAVIFEKAELDQLGLDKAVGGVFGYKQTQPPPSKFNLWKRLIG